MALVLDASAIAEFLVMSPAGEVAAEHLAAHAGELHVPHVAVVETASVLRAWHRRGDLSEQRALGALDDLASLPARRWEHDVLLWRMWELRDNVTAYDAAYVALSELLGADLLSGDQRLARGVAGVSPCRILTLPAFS